MRRYLAGVRARTELIDAGLLAHALVVVLEVENRGYHLIRPQDRGLPLVLRARRRRAALARVGVGPARADAAVEREAAHGLPGPSTTERGRYRRPSRPYNITVDEGSARHKENAKAASTPRAGPDCHEGLEVGVAAGEVEGVVPRVHRQTGGLHRRRDVFI